MLVEHVEDVYILYAYRIVEVFSSERIFEIDDIVICREIIVENLSISNYYIVFFTVDIDPRSRLLGFGGFIRDIEYIVSP